MDGTNSIAAGISFATLAASCKAPDWIFLHRFGQAFSAALRRMSCKDWSICTGFSPCILLKSTEAPSLSATSSAVLRIIFSILSKRWSWPSRHCMEKVHFPGTIE